MTGLVLHELALPSPDLDAAARIRALIDTLGWESSLDPLTKAHYKCSLQVMGDRRSYSSTQAWNSSPPREWAG